MVMESFLCIYEQIGNIRMYRVRMSICYGMLTDALTFLRGVGISPCDQVLATGIGLPRNADLTRS